MNKQEIFDKVANHLMKQKAKATNGNGCQYLAGDGKKCAVGCLIPKSVYDKYGRSIEGNVANAASLFPVYKEIGINLRNTAMLYDLQSVHDDYEVEDWKKRLKEVALKYHLKQPACLK